MPWTENDKLIRVHQIKIETGAFVNHVRVETFRTEQTYTRDKLFALAGQHIQFRLKLSNFSLNAGPANQPQLAVERVKTKINKRTAGSKRNDKPTEKRLLTLTGSSGHGRDLDADTNGP